VYRDGDPACTFRQDVGEHVPDFGLDLGVGPEEDFHQVAAADNADELA